MIRHAMPDAQKEWVMAIIKVEDIAHVRFAVPDLALMRGFLEDFGLSCFEQGGRLYGKGSDGRPFIHATDDPMKLLIGHKTFLIKTFVPVNDCRKVKALITQSDNVSQYPCMFFE